jgi:hypothetical protein
MGIRLGTAPNKRKRTGIIIRIAPAAIACNKLMPLVSLRGEHLKRLAWLANSALSGSRRLSIRRSRDSFFCCEKYEKRNKVRIACTRYWPLASKPSLQAAARAVDELNPTQRMESNPSSYRFPSTDRPPESHRRKVIDGLDITESWTELLNRRV